MPGLFRCDRGDYARVLCLISHARLRVHWAPGIPCALCFLRAEGFYAQLGRIAPRDRGVVFEKMARLPDLANAQPRAGSRFCEPQPLLRRLTIEIGYLA